MEDPAPVQGQRFEALVEGIASFIQLTCLFGGLLGELIEG